MRSKPASNGSEIAINFEELSRRSALINVGFLFQRDGRAGASGFCLELRLLFSGGPETCPRFDESAIMWSALYYLMARQPDKMNEKSGHTLNTKLISDN